MRPSRSPRSTLAGRMDKVTKFIPVWVKVAVAIALGLGTMIGWKRIVVTVGEKIGKTHLTYAQGAAAELVAAGTILAADHSVFRSARPTYFPRAWRGLWPPTTPACRWIRCETCCWPGS